MKDKPEEWGRALDDCIREGLNFKATNERLVAGLGEEGKVSGAAFQRHKKKIDGGPEVDSDLKAINEKLKGDKPQKPQRPAWSKQKQKAADESPLAKIINKGMFAGLMPVCKNKKLTEADVQEVNLGGAVVGTVGFFFPNVNLDHPLVLLATRGIILYLKFKAICSKVEEIKEKILHIGEGGKGSDIKEGWKEPEI